MGWYMKGYLMNLSKNEIVFKFVTEISWDLSQMIIVYRSLQNYYLLDWKTCKNFIFIKLI